MKGVESHEKGSGGSCLGSDSAPQYVHGRRVRRVGLAVLGGVMTVEAAFAGKGLDVDGGGSVKHSSHRSLTF